MIVEDHNFFENYVKESLNAKTSHPCKSSQHRGHISLLDYLIRREKLVEMRHGVCSKEAQITRLTIVACAIVILLRVKGHCRPKLSKSDIIDIIFTANNTLTAVKMIDVLMRMNGVATPEFVEYPHHIPKIHNDELLSAFEGVIKKFTTALLKGRHKTQKSEHVNNPFNFFKHKENQVATFLRELPNSYDEYKDPSSAVNFER